MTSGSMFGICMSPKGEAPKPVNVEGLGVGGIGGIGSDCAAIAVVGVDVALDALGVEGVVFAGALFMPERTT